MPGDRGCRIPAHRGALPPQGPAQSRGVPPGGRRRERRELSHMTRRHTGKVDLGMDTPITRRDFVNGVLVTGGAALLWGGQNAALADAIDAYAPSGSPWTGYGGVGDYRWANGNTEAVMNAAHGIRDGVYADASGSAVEEEVDLVIVGGGFSGMTAAYEFNKRRKPGQTCLLLENH